MLEKFTDQQGNVHYYPKQKRYCKRDATRHAYCTQHAQILTGGALPPENKEPWGKCAEIVKAPHGEFREA